MIKKKMLKEYKECKIIKKKNWEKE
jgi:hypothetical protein